ncbi:MAG: hypothetical protein ACQESP_04875 [Candidatus Muiribacteriota bacterium]
MGNAFFEYIKNLDRRIIYVVILLSVVIPVIFGVQLPVLPTPMTDAVIDALDGLEPGSTVLLSADYDPGSQAELQPMLTAFLTYAFENDLKVISMGLWPLGPSLVEDSLESDRIRITKDKAVELMQMGNKVYVTTKTDAGTEQYLDIRDGNVVIVREAEDDEDDVSVLREDDIYYVRGVKNLFPEDHIKYGENYLAAGYQVGAAIVIIDLVADFKNALRTDSVEGRNIGEFPITEGIDTLRDIDLVFTLSSGSGGIKEWIVYGNGRTRVPVAAGVTAVSAPEFLPYITSKQLSGMLAGLAGAAEFEAGTNFEKGRGVRGMTPQSFAHMVIIFFIILGNIIFFIEKTRENK